ncbi:Uu.00g079150.m01.CDS01 [Anthostomella pinea]|uniref:Uu.00g079150.m01.CDS01 n=1 Tax=Anthostomella pinea TaxID=933095 RepID=A0AAI8VKP9_9PEZI|nr:Uu.00g079150.m01.CDS01 [Anthostomella pinea]
MSAGPVKRVVVCVDGTWYDPHGAITRREGNNSNVYRIWASIKQGTFIRDDRPVKQVAHYEAGVGIEKQPVDAFNDDITTSAGCDGQVDKIFAYCCDQLSESTDELWLYGFSRGAYVVSVVADLLHQLSTLQFTGQKGFEMRLLSLTPFRQSTQKAANAAKLYRFLTAKALARQPLIHFAGLFDAIKVPRDQSKPDPPLLKSIRNVRHALALNENRRSFQPCPFGPVSLSHEELQQRSLIEAWFIGSHADLGGGSRDDGLSLYPLQWILLASREKGLVLDHASAESNINITEEPLGLVLPMEISQNSSEPPRPIKPWKFKYINGIEIEMLDLRASHRHGNLQTRNRNVLKKKSRKEKEKDDSSTPPLTPDADGLQVRKRSWKERLSIRSKLSKSLERKESDAKSILSMSTSTSTADVAEHRPRPHIVQINPGAALMSLFLGPRTVFQSHQLIGFLDSAPYGTIIHPSIYFVSDLYDRLGIADPLALFLDDLCTFRQDKFRRQGRVHVDPWRADLAADMGGYDLENCRVLVCGRAGVGKSTLINKVFGTIVTEESYNDHGVHDVDEGFEVDTFPGLIVHDSRGFQSGTTREIELLEQFVKKRASASDPEEKLSAIWFCIDVPSTRLVHEADKKIFEVLDKVAKAVPVIIVRTMKDRFINEHYGQAREELEDQGVTGEELDRRARALSQEKFLQVKEEDINQLEQKLGLEKDFAPFVYVSKRDLDSIKELVKQTVVLVPDDGARRNFVSAQIADLDPKISQALEETVRLLNYSNWSTMAGSAILVGSTISTPTISRMLCTRIIKCFGILNSVDKIDEVERIAQRVLWRNLGTFMTLNMGQIVGILGITAGLTFASVFGGIPVLASLPFATIPPAARMVTKCACDLILILAAAFSRKGKVVTKQDFQDASTQYCSKTVEGEASVRTRTHKDVDKLIPIISVKFYQPLSMTSMRTALQRLIVRHRFTLADAAVGEVEPVDGDTNDVRYMHEWKNLKDEAGDDDLASANLTDLEEKKKMLDELNRRPLGVLPVGDVEQKVLVTKHLAGLPGMTFRDKLAGGPAELQGTTVKEIHSTPVELP